MAFRPRLRNRRARLRRRFYQGGSWTNYDFTGNAVPPGTRNNERYHIDAHNAAAQAFIKRHHDEPFFLYVAQRAPHVPLDATEKYLKRFPGKMPERRRQALAMLSAVDDGVGGIVESLKEYDLEKRTLIFVIGDNGAPLKVHKLDAPGGGPGWDGSLNDPLNGEKGMLSEGGIRVPFVVSWQGTLPAGKTYDHPVISLDVAATATSLAGLPADRELDGVDLIPYLRGNRSDAPHEMLFWRWIAQAAVREGNWKYLRGGAREYLFDLSTDKEEKHNLLAKHPDVAGRLRKSLSNWARELNPPGLETKEMSRVWEQYFDFYLDGKPAPPLSDTQRRGRTDGTARIQGWIARNGSAALRNGVLEVRPGGGNGKRSRPFIAAAGLQLPASPIATVRLRTAVAGKAAFAWREAGQQDFPAEQAVMFDCAATDDWQQHKVKLPADGKVIHVRLLLPPAGADVQSIEFPQCRVATSQGMELWPSGRQKRTLDRSASTAAIVSAPFFSIVVAASGSPRRCPAKSLSPAPLRRVNSCRQPT